MTHNYSKPKSGISSTAMIAPSATVIGDVSLGDLASVWFGAVIRGDSESIRIGDRTNVQDGAILHADPGLPCLIDSQVTIGHGAVVHGATVGQNVMIGIRAVVLNGAEIGEGSLIAANCLVTENTRVPPNSVFMGIPGKVVRETTEADKHRLEHAWRHYVDAQTAFRSQHPPST